MLVVIDSFLDGAFVFTVVRFSTEIVWLHGTLNSTTFGFWPFQKFLLTLWRRIDLSLNYRLIVVCIVHPQTDWANRGDEYDPEEFNL